MTARSAPRVLALYPGMGAVAVGMGRKLRRHGAGESAFAEFGAASGTDVARLAAEASDEELRGDRSWELAVVATETAATAAYVSSGGSVAGALGFSIGAYAALHAAGMVTVRQIVTMIDIVLEASRTLPGNHAMAAVTGPPVETVAALCRPGAVEVSAVLAPGQTVVAGRADAVAELCRLLAPVALRVSPVSVRWPLHTTMMEPVAARLEAGRAGVGSLRPPHLPVYSGIDGSRIEDPSEGWGLLVRHLVQPQRFDRALAAVVADGFTRFVELGPGTTLARLARRLAPEGAVVESFPGGGRATGAAGRC